MTHWKRFHNNKDAKHPLQAVGDAEGPYELHNVSRGELLGDDAIGMASIQHRGRGRG
ncbi:hypothetical protein WAI453_009597 [Rhynchosporium graminicola]